VSGCGCYFVRPYGLQASARAAERRWRGVRERAKTRSEPSKRRSARKSATTNVSAPPPLFWDAAGNGDCDVSSVQERQRVRVTTITFTPTWTTQKAPAETLTTAKILLLGDWADLA
jgi:hypothetical protein